MLRCPSMALPFLPPPCSVLSAVVCAFDLSPLSMPLPLTEQAVAVMCNLYQGQPALCDSFWAEERLSGATTCGFCLGVGS